MVEIADGLRPEQRIDGNEPLVAVIKNLFASGLTTKARVTSRTNVEQLSWLTGQHGRIKAASEDAEINETESRRINEIAKEDRETKPIYIVIRCMMIVVHFRCLSNVILKLKEHPMTYIVIMISIHRLCEIVMNGYLYLCGAPYTNESTPPRISISLFAPCFRALRTPRIIIPY